jgi:hypothetical protein
MLRSLPQSPASSSVRGNRERGRVDSPTFRLSTLTYTDRNYLMPREYFFFSGGLKFLVVTKLQHQMHFQSHCPNGEQESHRHLGDAAVSGIPRCLHLHILESVLEAPTSSERTKRLCLVLLALFLDVLVYFALENLLCYHHHKNEWVGPELPGP